MRRLWFTVSPLVILFALSPFTAAAQDVGGDQPPPLNDLSNEALWSMLIGIAVPFITALINKQRWASDLKLAVFFVVTLITTGVTVALRGDLDAANYLRTGLIILVSAALTFQAAKPAVHTIEART